MRIPAPLLAPRHQLRSLLCPGGASILEAMEQIDANGKGVLFIIGESGEFLGTVTEGDIRRALLAQKGFTLSMRDLALRKDSVSMPFGTPLKDLVARIGPGLRIIPLVDAQGRVADYFELKASFHAPIASTDLAGNELAYVLECVTTNWISSQGEFIRRFESRFAEFIGVGEGVAVMNGTVAIHLALVALGIGPGDEVIVPDLTFAATINPVLQCGATPVLCDVEPDGWCLDPAAFEAAVTPKTKAVIPVHLYGQPCAMDAVMAIARRHGLFVVEDCAEAHGAAFDGKRVGSFGDVACFSFFANKIVTTGEGGMCLTSNPELAERMRRLRDHGMHPSRRYWHETVGFNYRMTNLQAAVGVAQMERIGSILERREAIRDRYNRGFAGFSAVIIQPRLQGRESVNWLYSLRCASLAQRDGLLAELKAAGIDARPFFHPLSRMPAYAAYARRDVPVAAALADTGFNLPTVLSFTEEQFRTVVDRVRSFLAPSDSKGLEGSKNSESSPSSWTAVPVRTGVHPHGQA